MKVALTFALYMGGLARATPLCGGLGYGALLRVLHGRLKKNCPHGRYSVGCQGFLPALKDVDV